MVMPVAVAQYADSSSGVQSSVAGSSEQIVSLAEVVFEGAKVGWTKRVPV
jgi:hypothetical protein